MTSASAHKLDIAGQNLRPAAADEVEAILRARILSCAYDEGAVLLQAMVARELQVSRSPVREAMRALEAEGLLIAEPNGRMRVTSFSLSDLEDIYATRIFLESLGIALSIPRMDEAHFDLLDRGLARITDDECYSDFDTWLIEHRRFHMNLVAFCGDALYARIDRLQDQSIRIQRLYSRTQPPNWWASRASAHVQLVSACKAGQAAWAARLTAQHLGQTALTLVNQRFGDDAKTGAIEAAIEMVTSGAAAFATGSTEHRKGAEA